MTERGGMTTEHWDEAADVVLYNAADPVYAGIPGEYAAGYRQGIRDATRALRARARTAREDGGES